MARGDATRWTYRIVPIEEASSAELERNLKDPGFDALCERLDWDQRDARYAAWSPPLFRGALRFAVVASPVTNVAAALFSGSLSSDERVPPCASTAEEQRRRIKLELSLRRDGSPKHVAGHVALRSRLPPFPVPWPRKPRTPHRNKTVEAVLKKLEEHDELEGHLTVQERHRHRTALLRLGGSEIGADELELLDEQWKLLRLKVESRERAHATAARARGGRATVREKAQSKDAELRKQVQRMLRTREMSARAIHRHLVSRGISISRAKVNRWCQEES